METRVVIGIALACIATEILFGISRAVIPERIKDRIAWIFFYVIPVFVFLCSMFLAVPLIRQGDWELGAVAILIGFSSIPIFLRMRRREKSFKDSMVKLKRLSSTSNK